MSETTALPYICKEHPHAQIRHLWTEKRYVMNGVPTGEALKSEHKYECGECRRELAAEEASADALASERMQLEKFVGL